MSTFHNCRDVSVKNDNNTDNYEAAHNKCSL